jgi:hypothetical protein
MTVKVAVQIWKQRKARPGGCSMQSPSMWTTSGVPEVPEYRMDSAWFGQGAVIKQRALDTALLLAA